MDQKFLEFALLEAKTGMRNNHGGPFGAVIIQNGEVISSAHNEVIRTHDPTAHAEIQAIRAASRKLRRFDLSDCEIYSTCEPCPMCLGAIHWAKFKKLYYGSTRYEAAKIGFDDQFIYDVILGTSTHIQVEKTRMECPECAEIFTEWQEKRDKTPY